MMSDGASDEDALVARRLELVELFLECVRAAPGSAEQTELARRFNRTFQALADEHPDEGLPALALRISQLGVPYEQVFSDLVLVRGLGAE